VWTLGNYRRAAMRAELAAFPIVAATFGTAHIAPLWLRWVCPVKLVSSFILGRVKACRELVIGVTALPSSHCAACLAVNVGLDDGIVGVEVHR